MKFTFRMKMMVAAFLLTIAMVMPGMVSEAKTITMKAKTEKYLVTVGSERTFSGNTVKINNKKVSKMKSKVKSVATAYEPTNFSYRTKSYFDTSAAYATEADYDMATNFAYKYKSYTSYDMKFLKAGTYTIKTENYQREQLSMESAGYNSDLKTTVYELRKYNPIEYEWEKASDKQFVREYVDYLGYVYVSTDGKTMYDWGDEGYLTTVQAKKGADGAYHAYYAPCNVIKVVRSQKYKVSKTSTAVIKSVQLGKAKHASSATYSANSYKGSSTTAPFLSGNKGKVKVKLNSNYKLMSIVVKTYDKDGKTVYKQVKNKGNVEFGKYPYQYQYTRSTYKALYKATTVYVSYKDKTTGEWTKLAVKTDAYGNQYIESTYYDADEKKTVTVDYLTGEYDSVTFYKK